MTVAAPSLSDMDKTKRTDPTIAELVEEFFCLYKPTAPCALRKRIDLVRSHLGAQLEVAGARELTSGQLLLLEAERAFNPENAFARTMHAPELYFALSRYLGPDSAMSGDRQRNTRVDVVAALASFLWSRRLVFLGVVSECDVIEFDIAMGRARDVRRRGKSK
jgi:hypothetical protein